MPTVRGIRKCNSTAFGFRQNALSETWNGEGGAVGWRGEEEKTVWRRKMYKSMLFGVKNKNSNGLSSN